MRQVRTARGLFRISWHPREGSLQIPIAISIRGFVAPADCSLAGSTEDSKYGFQAKLFPREGAKFNRRRSNRDGSVQSERGTDNEASHASADRQNNDERKRSFRENKASEIRVRGKERNPRCGSTAIFANLPIDKSSERRAALVTQ
jgi:predicted HNH restriction endonuclease